MKIKFLGTAAAEGVPAPFCDCRICRMAREKKGIEIRRRCSICIDQKIIIDLGPDFVWSSVEFDLWCGPVSCVLLSHTHFDHLSISNLLLALSRYGRKADQKILIIGSRDSYRYIKKQISILKVEKFWETFTFKVVEPFDLVKHSNYLIRVYPSNHIHKEQSLLYSVSDENGTIFYGTDTRPYDVADVLGERSTQVFDIVISDCTYVLHESRRARHMGIYDNVKVKKEMEQMNVLQDKSKYILTHFSHDALLPHFEMEKICASYGMLVAYDGLELII